jgi:hypothetical protein
MTDLQEGELDKLQEEKLEKFPTLHWLITRIHDTEVLYLKNKCVYGTYVKSHHVPQWYNGAHG